MELKRIIPLRYYYKYLAFKFRKRKKINNNKIKNNIEKNYYKVFNKSINWNNPISYTEKMNVSKFLNSNDTITFLTDKCLVRDWVKEKIGEEYLIPIIGIYDSFEEINFDDLPNQFVIKCNHDSGSAFICKNKKDLDLKTLKYKYDYFLKRDYSMVSYEMHYRNIEPKIIIEKYMGENVKDYKFLCFNGKPEYCWVDFDRFTNHKRNIYDLNWKLQPFNQRDYGNYKEPFDKPDNFEKMIELVKELCKDFEQVRVDLYDVNNIIYFGEMTFTNGSGLEPIVPEEYDIMLGNMWNLNTEKK